MQQKHAFRTAALLLICLVMSVGSVLAQSVPTITLQSFDKEHGFAATVGKLAASVQGQTNIAAQKNGYFETAEDKANAVVRMDVDVVGKGDPAPLDVLFVVDQSGSMNMYGNYDALTIHCTNTCLNDAHWYDVPYLYFDEAGQIVRGTYPIKCSEFPTQNINDLDKSKSFCFEKLDEVRAMLGDIYIDRLQWDDGNQNYDPDKYASGMLAVDLVTNRHFRYAADGVTKEFIPMSGGFDYDTDYRDPPAAGETDNRALYFSPAKDNPYGCIDRALLVRNNITKFGQALLAANPESRIGYIGFAEDTFWHNDFAHELVSGLGTTNGYNYTNYAAGFVPALEMVNESIAQYPNRRRVVIFISDGLHTHGDETAYQALLAADAIRLSPLTTTYGIGIWPNLNVDVMAYVSSPGCWMNCTSRTGEDFEAYLERVMRNYTTGNAQLVDEINTDAFELCLDEAHPMRVILDGGQERVYTTYTEAAADGVVCNGTRFEWDLQMSMNGARLTYYLKLKDEAKNLPLTELPVSYPTNENAFISNLSEDHAVLEQHELAPGAVLTLSGEEQEPSPDPAQTQQPEVSPEPTQTAQVPPPRTGDGATPALWIVLAVGCAAVAVALISKKKNMSGR